MSGIQQAVKRARAGLRRGLKQWFSRHAQDLPWRRTRDPYAIWVSEIMLQQTQVETVKPYFARWLQHFPDFRRLAAADEREVLKLWEGLGYYRRALNIHRAARQIAGNGNKLPTSAEGWQALPGIGRYTAGAIASIAHGEQAAVLDGNIKRVYARVFDIHESVEAPVVVKTLWQVAEDLVPPTRPGDYNQALMELGRLVCKPRAPLCEVCPIRRHCRAQAAGTQDDLPVKQARRKAPHIQVAAGAIAGRGRRKGRFLLGRRPEGSMLAGLWEFPGGKLEQGETAAQALVRELKEELGVEAEVGAFIGTVDHAYTHLKVTLHFYACRIRRGRPRARYHGDIAWIAPDEFAEYALPGANHKLLAALRTHFGKDES